ncbi:MAG: hypothetical protein JW891_17160, partial [Candidatus Lokiarchaeota archaeon]|nr:hypothetical protein [Candidatus Lokiarchaeota archaeon]
MTSVSENEFTKKLYEIVYKLSSIGKSQTYRFRTKWNEYFNALGKPHLVRDIPVEEGKFVNDLDYRIETLKILERALVDGFYTIKTLLNVLYDNYFNDSEQFLRDFSKQDQIILKYIVAKEILGNLIQYNRLDNESVPLKYNLIARNYSMMKLREITDDEVLNNMEKLNFKNIDLQKIRSSMEEVERDEIISIESRNDKQIYAIKTELKLSKQGKNNYAYNLEHLVSWPTQFWRSMYNIRELNVTPDDSCTYRDYLQKVLSKSATQGFTPTHYVVKHLIKYYEKIKEESQ